MKHLILITIVFINFTFKGYSQTKNDVLNKANTILFLGDSITYHGHYITFLEAYLSIKYPDQAFQFINLGLSSETVSGLSEANHAKGKFPRPDLHERLDRILNKTKPDLVFACYGMNDGIYLPFNNSRFSSFKNGINWLHDKIDQINVPIIHLTPPNYDKDKAYTTVLDIYSNWLLSKQYSANWKVIDLHWPMQDFLDQKRKTDPSFFLAKDGIHPNKTGHWLMAKQILLYFDNNDVTNINNPENAFNKMKNGLQILNLVDKHQIIMKHAWLTYTKHSRPNIKAGLPLADAKQKSEVLKKEIKLLLK